MLINAKLLFVPTKKKNMYYQSPVWIVFKPSSMSKIGYKYSTKKFEN